MLKRLVILCLIVIAFDVKSANASGLSNIKVYFENREDARDFENLIDKDEELFLLDSGIKPTGNGGYYFEIKGVDNKNFKKIRELQGCN